MSAAVSAPYRVAIIIKKTVATHLLIIYTFGLVKTATINASVNCEQL